MGIDEKEDRSDGQQIGQNLRGIIVVSQTVPHEHVQPLEQILDGRLSEPVEVGKYTNGRYSIFVAATIEPFKIRLDNNHRHAFQIRLLSADKALPSSSKAL